MKSDAGFTLVELLVAIAVLGLLMVLLFGGLRFGARAWERSDTTVSATDQIRLVQSLLHQEIERACPRQIGPAKQTSVDFTGEAQSMSFLSPVPLALGVPGCARVGFVVKPEGRGTSLFFEVQPPDALPRERSLLPNVAAVEFAYLGSDEVNTPAVWHQSWTNRVNLPLLVRLRVTFPRGDTRIWPELFVSPRIFGEADCIYDPKTKSCGTN